MYEKIIYLLLVTGLVITMSGCNSGDSNNNTDTFEENNNTYNIRATSTKTLSFDILGSDTENSEYNGSFKRRTFAASLEPTTSIGPYTGELLYTSLVEQNVTIMDITNDWTLQTNSTWLYDAYGALIYLERSSGVTCSLDGEATPLPTEAKIGDSGDSGSFTCSDGTSFEESWSLENANNGNAILIQITYNKDSGGQVDEIEMDSYIIDTDGNFISMTTTLYYPSTGGSINLNGN